MFVSFEVARGVSPDNYDLHKAEYFAKTHLYFTEGQTHHGNEQVQENDDAAHHEGRVQDVADHFGERDFFEGRDLGRVSFSHPKERPKSVYNT